MTDRARLIDGLAHYADAFAARDPRSLRLAPGAIFTENGQRLDFGQAAWRTVSDVGPCYASFVDPATGQAAAYHRIEENGQAAVLMLRIAMDGDLIAGVETIVCRNRPFLFAPDNMARHSPILRPVAPAARADRATLAAIPDAYFDGIVADDAQSIPVSPDCIRVECGEPCTACPPSEERAAARGFDLYAMSVAEQIDSRFFAICTGIEERRVLVDEEQSIALAIARFDFDGSVLEYEMPGIGRRATEPYYLVPRSILIAEAFQMVDGLVRSIETVWESCPFGMRSGW